MPPSKKSKKPTGKNSSKSTRKKLTRKEPDGGRNGKPKTKPKPRPAKGASKATPDTPKKAAGVRSAGRSGGKTIPTTDPPTKTPQKRRGAGLKGKRAKPPKKPPVAAPTQPLAKPAKPPFRQWYVLAVEPGEDGRARKAIRREKKIAGLERYIGRVYSPVHIEEITLPKAGEVIAEGGGEHDARTARLVGNVRAWELAPTQDFLDRSRPCPEGYRVAVFPETRGQFQGTWKWQVKKELSGEERMVKRKRLKFPGYLIAHLRLSVDAFHLVTSARGVVGLLMSNERPTPLESEKAAELLIQQSEANKEAKTMNKAVELDFKVGDRVRVMDGTWKGQIGRVLQISGPDTDPVISVEVTVLGQSLSASVPHWLLVNTNKGK